MTVTELQQLNTLREENRNLKEENERLRARVAKLLYGVNQAIDSIKSWGSK